MKNNNNFFPVTYSFTLTGTYTNTITNTNTHTNIPLMKDGLWRGLAKIICQKLASGGTSII